MKLASLLTERIINSVETKLPGYRRVNMLIANDITCITTFITSLANLPLYLT